MKYAERLQRALIPVMETLTTHHLSQTGRAVAEMDGEERTRIGLALFGAAWQVATRIIGEKAANRAFALAVLAAQNGQQKNAPP